MSERISFAQRQAQRSVQEAEMFPLLRLQHNIARFEEKISYEPMSGCWLWCGATGKHGHGQFFLRADRGSILTGAHRASWMIYRHQLLPTDVVCHRCDNPFCVNPEHLFVGTQRDNMRDARRKGRLILPDVVGEANPAAVLSEQDVIAIRQSTRSIKDIAAQYGVSPTTIHYCLIGRTWSHVSGFHKAKSRGAEWTSDQDELVMSDLSVAEIARRTGRSIFSIYSRRSKIKKRTGMRRRSDGGHNAHVYRKAG